MPVIHPSGYRPPRGLANPHIQMLLSNQFRAVPHQPYDRERISTPDGDFLDLDWIHVPSARKVVVLCHGLEGHSKRPYVRGMARHFRKNGWNVCAMNYRGCSGEPNLKPRFYHSGATEDLDAVVRHIEKRYPGQPMALVGFSLGANLILKFLGDLGREAPSAIRGAVVFSAPCDLAASAAAIARPRNRVYMRRFLNMLREKIEIKEVLHPGMITARGFDAIRTFEDFDNRYTAPLHGFRDARDYWNRASSKPVLSRIAVPTLMVSARDDPFLGPECFPFEAAYRNPRLFLEVPDHGSHVGFFDIFPDGTIWSERRALGFLETARPQ